MTGPVADAYVASMVKFLSRLKQRGPEGALTIRVQDVQVNGLRSPIDGASVSIEGPASRSGTTTKGEARFENVPPGTYRVHAAMPGYGEAQNRAGTREVTVVPYGCPSGSVWLDPQLEVGGIVTDRGGEPVSNVTLQLWEQAKWPMVRVFEAKSDSRGRFRFHKVKPGTFHLLTANELRKSYYPGRSSKAESVPLDVRAGADLENLQFGLIDSGPERLIRVRVVDLYGKPIAGAIVRDYPWDDEGRQEGAYSSFGGKPMTSTDGSVMLRGYEAAHYRVDAFYRSPIANTSFVAAPVDIPPGQGNVEVVLTPRARGAARPR